MPLSVEQLNEYPSDIPEFSKIACVSTIFEGKYEKITPIFVLGYNLFLKVDSYTLAILFASQTKRECPRTISCQMEAIVYLLHF